MRPAAHVNDPHVLSVPRNHLPRALKKLGLSVESELTNLPSRQLADAFMVSRRTPEALLPVLRAPVAGFVHAEDSTRGHDPTVALVFVVRPAEVFAFGKGTTFSQTRFDGF